jgi:hypothetical protein
MRCPKCGYISFDQEEACSKCNADLTEINSILSGTAVRVRESCFLASILGQEEGRNVPEELEFDLAEAMPESGTEIEITEDEGIPVVDLSPFEQHQEIKEDEDAGINFAFPEEEGGEAIEPVEAAENARPLSDMQGTIDFSFEDEPAHEDGTIKSTEETPEFDLVLEGNGEKKAAEQFGGDEFELEEKYEVESLESGEVLPELEFEMGEEAEQDRKLDAGLPDIELEDFAEEPFPGGSATSVKGSGLILDIDVNLEEDEPREEEMVFNLEDIDMSDLVIDSPRQGKIQPGRPEELILDLEDFLSSDKSDEKTGIPMDLSMEHIDLLDDDQEGTDKKLVNLPNIEL